MSRELSTPVTTNVTLTTTTETVIATLSGVSSPRAGVKIRLHGWYQVTLGTATTAVTTRIRQGTGITGTLIQEANAEQISTAAASSEGHSIDVEDTLGEVANVSYVLTVEQTAATANGTVLQAQLRATIDS